jgi:hypothetical protein
MPNKSGRAASNTVRGIAWTTYLWALSAGAEERISRSETIVIAPKARGLWSQVSHRKFMEDLNLYE